MDTICCKFHAVCTTGGTNAMKNGSICPAVLNLFILFVISISSASAQSVLEEIVVTARKREQNLQNVSISISAFTANRIQEMGLLNSQDLSWMTPGMYASGAVGNLNPMYTIRGIGLNDFFTNNNPTVGLYVNEVIQPFSPMMSFQMFDLERIEVLKGPQGTLYGRNTTGGAINFISRRPGEELNGYLRAGYGEFDRVEAEGAIGGPISDDLGGRLAFLTTQQSDGWMRNAVTGKKVGEIDQVALRGILQWQPAENFEVEFIGSYAEDNSDTHLREHVGFADGPFSTNLCAAAIAGRRDEGNCVSFLGFFDPNADDRYTHSNSSILGNDNDTDTLGLTLKVNWDIGDMTLTSVTGYSEYDRVYTEDADGTALAMIDVRSDDDATTFSQELRLSGIMSRIDWVLGAFYSDNEISFNFIQDLRQHLFLSVVDTVWKQESSSVAVFGHADFALTNKLSIVGGLRYTYEEKKIRYDASDLNPFGTTQFLPPTVSGFNDRFSNNEISGQAGVDFQVTDDILTYFSFNRGFKTGGYKGAIAFSLAELEPFTQETVYAYEAGIKSTWANGRVRFNAAAYYSDWKDFQAFVNEIRGGIPVIVLTNAGDAEIYGIEADLLLHPTDGLDIQATLNWMDTEIKKFNNIPGTPDSTGNNLANSPDLMFNGRVRYEFPVANTGFNAYISSDFIFRDRVYYSLANRGQNSQASNWLWHGRAGVVTEDGKWEASVWGKNLTDEAYVTQSYDNTGGIFPSQNFIGEPRTYGVSVQYNF